MKRELLVYVPSLSRWQRSLTLEFLQGAGCTPYLVVPPAQRAQYGPLAARHGATLLPMAAKGIAAVRQGIGLHAQATGGKHAKFLMLDDDLRFSVRKNDMDWGLRPCAATDMEECLMVVESLLYRYAHVAISARQANNGLKRYPHTVIGRPLRALAYRAQAFNDCEHQRVQIMEDFDVTLQLLRRGYPNAIVSQFAQDQAATQQPGGCSDYRSHALHEKNVRKLAKLHAPFVKLVQKENKSRSGNTMTDEFRVRLEANIAWKKAYESSLPELR